MARRTHPSPVWKSTGELGYTRPRPHEDNIASMAWGAQILISTPPLTELEAVDVDNRGVAPRLGMFVDICKYSLAERGDLVRRRPRREVDRDAQRRLRAPRMIKYRRRRNDRQ